MLYQCLFYPSGLKDTIDEIQKDIGKRMYEVCLRGKIPQASDLLTKEDNVKLKRCIFAQGKKLIDKFLCHILNLRYGG
jgi:glycogen(starch) synthase